MESPRSFTSFDQSVAMVTTSSRFVQSGKLSFGFILNWFSLRKVKKHTSFHLYVEKTKELNTSIISLSEHLAGK